MVTFPFTLESILHDFPNQVCVGDVLSTKIFKPVMTISFNDDGTLNGSNCLWRVNNGILEFIDKKQHKCYVFDGLKLLENRVVLAGFQFSILGSNVILGSSQFLSDIDYGVLISSHVNYAEKTLPRLLRSLLMNGFPKERIRIVMEGINEDGVFDGIPYISSEKGNLWGYSGLLAANADFPYWLLLHDTCEVTSNFLNNLDNVDIGFNFSFIALGNHGIGLYSWDFISTLNLTESVNAIEFSRRIVFSPFLRRMDVSQVVISSGKDVYGTGQNRKIIENDLGLRKFERNHNSPARP